MEFNDFVYACNLINVSGVSIWDDLIAKTQDDTNISANVKLAIIVILNNYKQYTSCSPIHFEENIKSLLSLIESDGWQDQNLPKELIDTLTDEQRLYILSVFEGYILNQLSTIYSRVGSIIYK